MAGSQETFGKKEREKKRAKKRKEKEARKLARKEQGSANEFVYVDAYGNLTDTPPDPNQKIEMEAEEIVLGIPKKVEGEDDDIDTSHEGVVSFFDSSKGFGFIIDNADKMKYFVHVSGTLDTIEEGDKVTYELEQGKKGMNAVKVKKL